MAPQSNLKPQKLFAADSPGPAAAPNNEKATHIEVCARLRPLQISMQSSSSYFAGDHHNHASPRKPPVPSARKPGIPTPKASAKGKKTPQATPPKNKAPEEDLFYAWDVIGNDTASQSPRTDIVPGRTHQYTLDKVYGPSCSTKEVYAMSVKPLVLSAMEGYHSAVLAYGQTSTGKTFSMTGTPTSPGIIPLSIHQCFQCLEKDREYLIRVSYLEVYKEQIRDLLADGASQIRLFDHREQGLIIKGLREEVVTCPKQIFEILAQGEKRRKIGATNMNQHSSRSHVMVRLWIESRAVGSNNGSRQQQHQRGGSMANGKGTAVRVSSLSLVDLAGSESVKLHGANEARRQEGHYINKSLMALGKVVYALSEMGKKGISAGKAGTQHIPYRDSKLTRLLQPSLSGNAQMVLICCISPLAMHVEESHNTFKFAARAKKVPQKATIQESVDEKTLLQTYREEIEALKSQLRDAKKQQHILLEEQQEREQQQQQQQEQEEPEDIDGEVEELRLAIRNMEHLILKSKAATTPPGSASRKSIADDELVDSVLDDDDEDDEAALLALMSETQKSSGATRIPGGEKKTETPPRTPIPAAAAAAAAAATPAEPPEDTSSDMYAELHRIQGLLGSVLKKRSRSVKSPTSTNNKSSNGSELLGGELGAAGAASPKNTAEVNMLRAQLEEQEAASSLRKADAAFLTKQLEEKDNLLAEVSKILEQVEQRQVELEAENADLRKQLYCLKTGQPYNPMNVLRNGNVDI